MGAAPAPPGIAGRGLLALSLLAPHAPGAEEPPHSYRIERTGQWAIVRACQGPRQRDCRAVAKVPESTLRIFAATLDRREGPGELPDHMAGAVSVGALLVGGALTYCTHKFLKLFGLHLDDHPAPSS